MSQINRSREEWIGFRLNKLTVIDKLGEEIKSSVGGKAGKKYDRINDRLLVRCDCGKEYELLAGSLVNNCPGACRGCSIMKPCIGNRSGSLVVSDFYRTRSEGNRSILWYNCDCDCGGKHTVKADIFNIGDCIACPNCSQSGKYIQTRRIVKPSRYFQNIKSGSKRRKHIKDLPFDITLDFILSLLKSQGNCCTLSGLPIEIEDGTASLDRIDSSRGYTTDNVQWVHRTINFMKQEMSQEDFILFCQHVSAYTGPH